MDPTPLPEDYTEQDLVDRGLAPKPKRKRRKKNVHFSSEKQTWETPDELFDPLNAEFQFVLDSAATIDNTKCKFFISPESNGLERPWQSFGGAIWCNPPYGRKIGKWVAKAAAEAKKGPNTVVMLIPARPDTTYWAKHIWDHEKHTPRPGVQVRFVAGRIRFKGADHGAPFPSAIVVFNPPT